MKDKILQLKEKLNTLNEALSDPEIHSDQKRYRDTAREHSEISKLMDVGEEYLKVLHDYDGNKALISEDSDPELVELAEAELEELEERKEALEDKLKVMLIPKDPNDHKTAIVEIRAGTGGDEAAIFAGDLYRMYTKFCETKSLKTDIMNSSPSERGGF